MITFALCGDSPRQAIWRAWTVVVDPGTHTIMKRSPQRAASVVFTIGGLLFFALLVGLVNEEISSTFDDMQSGRSRVIEKDHLLLLGWSTKAASCVEQLALAHESCGGATIVVLANMDKRVMDEEVDRLVLNSSEVVTRSGSPLSGRQLLRASAKEV